MDLAVLVLILSIAMIILVILGSKNIWLSISILILFVVIGIFLIAPVKGKNKLYIYLFRKIVFLFRNKRIHSQRLKAYQKYYKSKNNIINLINEQKAVVYEINSININLMNQDERNIPIKRLYDVFRNINVPMELIKIQTPYDLYKHKKHTQKLWETKNEVEKGDIILEKQIRNIWNQQIDLEENNVFFRTKWFMVFYGNNAKQINDEIKHNIALIDNNLSFNEATDNDVKQLIKQHQLNINFKQIKKEKVLIKANHLIVNQEYIGFRQIDTFPQFVNDKWLFNLGNLDGINLNMKINHISEYDAIKKLNKAIERASGDDSRKASEQINVNNYYNNFLALLDMVKTSQESLKMINVVFTIKAKSLKELREKDNFLKNQIIKNNFSYDDLKYQQFEMFNQVFNKIDKKASDDFQEIACSSLASCWPFIPNVLDDEGGQLLGL